MNVTGLKIATVQMAIANEPMKNAERFLKEARSAVKKGADIVVGSEMMLTHYLSGDRWEDKSFIDEMWSAAMYIVAESANIDAVLIFGGIGLDTDLYKVGEDGRYRKYNAAFVVQKGQLIKNKAGLSFAIKSLMPNYRIFDDSRHFYDSRKLALERNWLIEDTLQPFPVVIKNKTYLLGVMLCEDMWGEHDYTIKPPQILKDNGADILINLSASNWSWRKNQKRDQVVAEICRKTGLWFVYVNNAGCQNNGKNFIVFDGSSTIYNPAGNIVAMSEMYKEVTEVVEIDDRLVALVRPELPDVAEMYKAIEVATFGFLDTLPSFVKRKAIIGVSGGMDSALSVAFFAHVLGPENVVAVNMPFRDFNSDETINDAEEMCRRLGVQYLSKPIDTIVDATAGLSGVEVGTSQHKTIQAVARMTVLSAVASQEGGFFTCNANWTEIAFGYGTKNGDMRGSFAPWMNCLKQDVYRLGDYLNREIYGREVIPKSIFIRPPMDELVAAGSGSRGDPFDYGDLLENGYHDQMVRAVLAFRRSPEWFVERYLDGTLESELRLSPGRLDKLFKSKEEWHEDLERCFQLFHNAITKRVESVPGPLVDKRSFGWDFRESILNFVQTKRYQALVAQLKEL